MSKGKIKVQLIHSPAGCSKRQKATVRGLGLTKLNQVRELIDSEPSRGMVVKVSHLVRIIEEGEHITRG